MAAVKKVMVNQEVTSFVVLLEFDQALLFLAVTYSAKDNEPMVEASLKEKFAAFKLHLCFMTFTFFKLF